MKLFDERVLSGKLCCLIQTVFRSRCFNEFDLTIILFSFILVSVVNGQKSPKRELRRLNAKIDRIRVQLIH